MPPNPCADNNALWEKKPNPRNAIGFTLIELLVVISIIALLISLLLPAMTLAQEMARIAWCASNERQLAVAHHAWGADNDGELPAPTSYARPGISRVLNRGMRNRTDFWTQLQPNYLPEKEAWYCPAGSFFADDVPPASVGFKGIWWDFHDTGTGGNAAFSYAFYCNADDYPTYDTIPRLTSDPGHWVLINDYTVIDLSVPWYAVGNHPAFAPYWVLTSPQITPQGVNVARLDGSVEWRPEPSLTPGYPGAGGSAAHFRLMH